MKIIISLLSLLIGCGAFASSPSLADEAALNEKVLKKSYPGGADEEPLTIQDDLPVGGRKITLEGLEKKFIDSTSEESNEPVEE